MHSMSASSLLESIFKTKSVQDAEGKTYPLKANISQEEGKFLQELIKQDQKVNKTLEIGCAQGISALYICGTLAEREGSIHLLIDPNQSGKWKNIGVSNLYRAKITKFKLIEAGSELVLPQLLLAEEYSYDLIFIDGLHTFDQVMLDLYYANRLLRVGGYLVIDDCSWFTVAKALSYFVQYPAYKLIGQTKITSPLRRFGKTLTSLLPWRAWQYLLSVKLYNLALRTKFGGMVALQKTALDERDGFWFAEI
ncbi:MAG: class I SAM-dependent methyltransferase [Anaerolineaceae bacterium]|jgi:predicted O-methyltransferase YrrM